MLAGRAAELVWLDRLGKSNVRAQQVRTRKVIKVNESYSEIPFPANVP